MGRSGSVFPDQDLSEFTSEQLAAALVAFEAVDCRESLYEFVKVAWKTVVQNHPFVDGWHIRAICDHLQAVTPPPGPDGKIVPPTIKDLLINIPPRHTKSLIVSVFWPAWVWTFRPEFQWLFASRTQAVSLRDNRKNRALIESRWYQDRWPLAMAEDQNAKGYFINSKGGHRQATSAGSQAVGLDADCMVFDDLHGINDSDERVATDVGWCEDTLWSRGNTVEAPRVGIGQRVRGGDISGHIIAGQAGGGWVKLILPMEFEPGRRCETGLKSEHFPDGFVDKRAPGDILCEARFPRWRVDELALKPGSYARLYQQNPTPAEGGIIKHRWLGKVFDEIDCAKVRKWGTSCDTPFKKGKNTDYFVMQLIAIVDQDYLIVDQIRGRMGFTEMKKAYKGFIDQWLARGIPITKNLLEAKASGEAILDSLGKVVRNIVPYDPGRDSKEVRFETASDTFAAGHVKTPAANATIVKDGKKLWEWHVIPEWVGGWREELGTVPLADHDDQADTTCQYILDDQMKTGAVAASAMAQPKTDVNAEYERPGKWRGGSG